MSEPLDPHVVGLLREQLDLLRDIVLDLWQVSANATKPAGCTTPEALDEARLEIHDHAHDALGMVDWCLNHCNALTLAFADSEAPSNTPTPDGGRVLPFPGGDVTVPK